MKIIEQRSADPGLSDRRQGCERYPESGSTFVMAKNVQKRFRRNPTDSLHIASAEMGAADVLRTTDDKLEKASANLALNIESCEFPGVCMGDIECRV